MGQDHLSFAQLAQSPLLDELYQQFLKDPLSVDSSWRYFFSGLELGSSKERDGQSQPFEGVVRLIDAYRRYGHLKAKTNPLSTEVHPVAQLQLQTYGFSEADLNRQVPTFQVMEEEQATLGELVDRLEATYCQTMGVEFMGLISPEFEQWMQEKLEPCRGQPSLTSDDKKQILEHLSKSEVFEAFLHTKYTGQKRFSIEGAETLIPMLQAMLAAGAEHGVEEFVFGMAHRGRLNVLSNLMRKSYGQIFCEFEKGYLPHETEGVSDVKYHKGYTSKVTLANGQEMRLVLSANPSHLESVNPVVQGQVAARQLYQGDQERKKIVGVQVHGDAAIAGQGVVYETQQFSNIKEYSTGGTIHIVLNNHLGFTALPQESRSTRYCTDIAKTFGHPVFHVNAEDPERCIYAMKLAMEIRQQFGIDVFIDLSCYRKYGHNESDEPMFTQPWHYQEIAQKKTVREIYQEQLIQQGAIDRQLAEQSEKSFKEALQKDLDTIEQFKASPPSGEREALWQEYESFPSEEHVLSPVATAVPEDLLQKIGQKICHIPEDLNLHRKLKRLVGEREKMLQAKHDEEVIDWGMAEHLALGSLLEEGVHVRIAGQDSQRGTFSHRQAAWIDQQDQHSYIPLSKCAKNNPLQILNSSLSEEAALGFEIGYSMAWPQSLVVWEAQFGDFANGAQNMIDEYVVSSEQKWGVCSGLVMLLPHGYEGQGPDHSSARLERFLQQAADLNIFVANPSTPAQLFHLLRRQVQMKFRKPLIVMSPKMLLRYPACRSSRASLSQGGFEEILVSGSKNTDARKVALVSGKMYYSLQAEAEKRGWKPFPCLRVEQLYPLHKQKLQNALAQYPNLEQLVWIQEEPKNMGAWSYIADELEEALGRKPLFVGSPKSASPAVGTHAAYEQRMKSIFDQFEQVIEG